MRVDLSASVADTFDVLWPGRDSDDPARPVTASYRAAPSVEDPRFLLPASRRHQAAVIRHFRPAATAAARRRSMALRAVSMVTGGWPITRGRLAVRGEGTIESRLTELLGEQVVLGVQLGPPRANRKPLLQVMDVHGGPLAVGKIGVDPLTNRLVDAEGAALAHLARVSLSPALRVPELVAHTDWHGAALVLMSHLPLAGARTPTDDHRDAAMLEIALCGFVEELRFGEGPVGRRLAADIDALSHPKVREQARAVLERLAGVRRPWRHGTWHGDWTAWNCAASRDQVLVWDWERMETGVPVGWDALHYRLRADLQGRPPSPEVTRDLLARAPRLLAPFGVAPEDATGVTSAYLLELAVRYTADGQREAGGRSARVEEWLLPVLLEMGDHA